MSPIELLYAKNTTSGHGRTAQQELAFVLLVQNLAYDKDVAVIWAGEDGVRRTLKAEYVRPAGWDTEVWQARALFARTTAESLPGNVRFNLHYRVAGREFCNPSDHRPYTIDADAGIRIGGECPLLNLDFQDLLYTGQQYYPVAIAAHQDLQPEEVSIRWTTNHWQTFTDTPAFLWRKHWHHSIDGGARNPNQYGCAVWISQLHLGDAYRVEYTLFCRSKGREYWDNNWGRNYLARRDRLKIMTLNLHCYQEDRQEEKFARIAKVIQELHVNVVCLQEVGELWNEGRGDWNSNAAKLIRDRLGESFWLCTDWSHFGFARYREGTAILSRHPFLARDSKYVSATQNVYDIHAHKVVMAQIDVPYFGLLNVFSVHLSWWQNGFREQFENLHRWAESKRTPDVAATLLCGDFNNAANSQGYALLSREYDDQFFKANAQQIDRAEDRRIDYLLVKKGAALEVQSACRLFTRDDYGPVSDHEGYCAEFEPSK